MDREIQSRRPHGHQGFTLVELISTLAVLSITLLAGIPALHDLLEQHRLSAHTNLLLGQLQFARSESVKVGQRIGLCPSNDGEFCDDAFDWSRGWIIFTDQNRNRRRDATEPLVRVSRADGAVRILTSTGRRRIIYQPDGTVLGGSNATFRLCGKINQHHNRAVIVSLTGRPRRSGKDGGGQPVQCS